MALPPIIRRNAVRITTTVTLVAGAIYSLCLVSGSPHVARIAAFIFAASATHEIVSQSRAPAPKGLAMVSMAAFVLILEGARSATAEGMSQTAFVEIGIGVYLMATLWALLGRPPAAG